MQGGGVSSSATRPLRPARTHGSWPLKLMPCIVSVNDDCVIIGERAAFLQVERGSCAADQEDCSGLSAGPRRGGGQGAGGEVSTSGPLNCQSPSDCPSDNNANATPNTSNT
jgi:hypothetical protein